MVYRWASVNESIKERFIPYQPRDVERLENTGACISTSASESDGTGSGWRHRSCDTQLPAICQIDFRDKDKKSKPPKPGGPKPGPKPGPGGPGRRPGPRTERTRATTIPTPPSSSTTTTTRTPSSTRRRTPSTTSSTTRRTSSSPSQSLRSTTLRSSTATASSQTMMTERDTTPDEMSTLVNIAESVDTTSRKATTSLVIVGAVLAVIVGAVIVVIVVYRMRRKRTKGDQPNTKSANVSDRPQSLGNHVYACPEDPQSYSEIDTCKILANSCYDRVVDGQLINNQSGVYDVTNTTLARKLDNPPDLTYNVTMVGESDTYDHAGVSSGVADTTQCNTYDSTR